MRLRVRNVHERTVAASPQRVGGLLDRLASDADNLWPRDRWPAMRFDRELSIGAVGGHGPVRYFVEGYEPGRSVRFRFTAPRGLDGYHGYEVEPTGSGATRLRHVLEVRAGGPALLTWPLVFRPLHDALLEDSLDRAQSFFGEAPPRRRWSAWVRFLRWALGRARR